MFVLDTDHLTLYQRGHLTLASRMRRYPPDQLAITVISVEEQMRGRLAQIRRSSAVQQLVEAYHWFNETFRQLSRLPVLPFDDNAAGIYQTLLASRIRVGALDLRIAAIAVSRGAVLLTRNRSDFEQVPELQIEDWTV